MFFRVVLRKALDYRKTIKKLKQEKNKLQHAIERLEHQLRLSRLEEKRLKERIIIQDSQRK